MFEPSTVNRIAAMVSGLTGYEYKGTVTAEKADGLRVTGDAAAANIAAGSIPARTTENSVRFMRGLLYLASHGAQRRTPQNRE